MRAKSEKILPILYAGIIWLMALNPAGAQEAKPSQTNDWHGWLGDGTLITSNNLKELLSRQEGFPARMTIVSNGVAVKRTLGDSNHVDLSGSALTNAAMAYAELKGADLSNADLRWTDLRGASLQNANLSNAKLAYANLSTAQLTGANLSGADLSHANLANALMPNANLSGANLSGADLGSAILMSATMNRVTLRNANLANANLMNAKLNGANPWLDSLLESKNVVELFTTNRELIDLEEEVVNSVNKNTNAGGEPYLRIRNNLLQWNKADFRGAQLAFADLSTANLMGADLSGVSLARVNLSHAMLVGADLTDASFLECDLTDAELEEANLATACFEPRPGALPKISSISRATNLCLMVYGSSPHALVELREAFAKAGLHAKEREVNYAIMHTQRKQAGWFEKTMLLAVEIPCAYGMRPGRPLKILVGLIFVFWVPYLIALKQGGRSGIWLIWPNERALKDEKAEKNTRLSPRKMVHRLAIALYFSLVSAFNVGWENVNVGTWIARMQPKEFTLNAVGWVRVLAGVQSLISVYMIALWVLSYFGHLFE